MQYQETPLKTMSYIDYNINRPLTWGFTCSYCGGSGKSDACDPDTCEQLTCEKCNGHGQTEDVQE